MSAAPPPGDPNTPTAGTPPAPAGTVWADDTGGPGAPVVLLANGDFEQQEDHPPLIECDEMIVSGIPGCRKIDVPGGDHLLPLRVPGLIADTMTELAG